jgi:hypothetical protein
MLAPPSCACEVQGTIVYPVNAEVKADAMLSLGVNNRVLNEGLAAMAVWDCDPQPFGNRKSSRRRHGSRVV